MHSFTTILTLAAFAMPSYAFTNGTLVPSYICNPQSDGLPKSFGQLLQYTQKKVTTLAFNNNSTFISSTIVEIYLTHSSRGPE